MTRMRVCQHCNEGFEVATTGRPPRYCSATCRKKAWEKRRLDEAVAIAVAKAVAAEQRRGRIRGNETPGPPENRGNETPPQATAPPATPDPRRGWTWSGLQMLPLEDVAEPESP